MPRRGADRRAEALRNLLLVVVTDRERCRGDLLASCEAAVRGGATAVLLRDKELPRGERRRLARRLRTITAKYGASLFVHTDAALAKEVDADGVHLDARAGPREITGAKRVVGRSRIVGVSTHSGDEAREAWMADADYAFLGPILPTESHPGRPALGWRAYEDAVLGTFPLLPIGGVTPEEIRKTFLHFPGGNNVAVVGSVLGAADPEASAGSLLAALHTKEDPWGGTTAPAGLEERSIVAGFLRSMGRIPGLALGPGDDAVVLRAGGVAVATDLTIEGVHYRRRTPARAAGFKAAGRALSDLAAIGADPLGLMVGLAVRRGRGAPARARGLEAGAAACARSVGARVLGGDTKETGGTETVAITALGRVRGRPPLARSGGSPGDALFVTGPLGGSMTRGRHLRPRPRVAVGSALRRLGLATACIDVSDGLAADLHRLCKASGTGAFLHDVRIPIHPDTRGRGFRHRVRRALHDGEDYELLFAVPPERAAAVEREGVAGRPVHRIGRLVHRNGGVSSDDGSILGGLSDMGWVHFRERDR